MAADEAPKLAAEARRTYPMTGLAQVDIDRLRRPDIRPGDVAQSFSRLGWGARARSLGPLGGEESAVELFSGGETQVLLVLSAQASRERAASLAYSREARYTGSWTPERLCLAQTTSWRSSPGDTSLFEASAESPVEWRNALELLSPDAVLDGAIDQLSPPSHPHPPLAEKLAMELARLRAGAAQAEALEGHSPEKRDLAVLRLFHKLLYLRIAEDRKVLPVTEGLRRILDADDPISATVDLLANSKAHLNSELFTGSSLPVDSLTAESLRTLLKAMIEPWDSLTLDFAVAHTELAGRLYESYLSLVPAIEDSGATLQMFPTVKPYDLRSRQASYYTPSALADVIVDRTLSAWVKAADLQKFSDVRVLDPACGSGTFLCASFRWLRRFFEVRKGRSLSSREREKLLTSSIFGADLDERSLGLAQVQLLELAELDGRLPLMAENLFHGDALTAPPGTEPRDMSVAWEELIAKRGSPTCIVTNPPFISENRRKKVLGSPRVADLDRLYANVRSKGADHAYVFISLADRLLEDGGAFGAVLPRKVLSGESGEGARKLLYDLGINWIADLRAVPIFADVDVGTCAVAALRPCHDTAWRAVVETAPSLEEDPRRVVDALRGVATGEQLLDRHEYASGVLQKRIDGGWGPFDLRRRTLRGFTGKAIQTRLADYATVTQGVKPAGAMRIDPSRVQVTRSELKIDGEEISSRYVPLLLSGRELSPFVAAPSGERVLLPFDDERNLVTDQGVQALLEKINGLPRNYRFGNLGVLRQPKILLRTVAFEPAAAADISGTIVPKVRAAHAIGFREASELKLLACAALLNSSIYQWLLRTAGTPRQGQFVEFSDRDIETLPWPDLDEAHIRCLGGLAQEAIEALSVADVYLRVGKYRRTRSEIDALGFDLMKVDKRTKGLVQAELRRTA